MASIDRSIVSLAVLCLLVLVLVIMYGAGEVREVLWRRRGRRRR